MGGLLGACIQAVGGVGSQKKLLIVIGLLKEVVAMSFDMLASHLVRPPGLIKRQNQLLAWLL